MGIIMTCHLLVPSLFLFSSKPSQVSSNLFRQLTPLIWSCELGGGGKIFPVTEKFCLRQNFTAELFAIPAEFCCGGIFAAEFHFPIRYFNVNILSFCYWNQVIQKPKFIYTCRTTTFTRDSRWDKIVLE